MSVISQLFLSLITLSILGTNPLDGEKTCIYVSAENGLNLRKEPSINSEIITTLPYGYALSTYDYFLQGPSMDHGLRW